MKTQNFEIVLPHITRDGPSISLPLLEDEDALQEIEEELEESKPTAAGIDAQHRLFVVSCIIFLTGIGIGAVLVSFGNASLLTYFSRVMREGILSRLADPLYVTFLNCLLPHIILLLFCALMANCSFGLPFIVLAILFKGISSGMMGGYICCFAGIKGILYNILIFMPPTLIAALALIRHAIRSAHASIKLYSVTYRNSSRNIRPLMAEVLHTLAIGMALSCLSAALEALLFSTVGPLFFVALLA